jgi:protein SYS1
MWWGAMSVSSALAVALGIWGSRYRELRPITFGGSATRTAENGDTSGGGGAVGAGAGILAGEEGSGAAGDEEQGFSRGRGRGRGRDGAGEYEMVGMKGEERKD